MPPTLVELRVADDPQLWSGLGFQVEGDRCHLGGIDVVLTGTGPAPGPGIHGWGWRDLGPGSAIGTIPTSPVTVPVPADPGRHHNGAVGLFYVVLFAPSWPAAATALTGVGIDPGRSRPMGGRPVHRSLADAGPTTVEVIGPPETDPERAWELWGMIVEVADIDETAATIGPRLRAVKPAVQRGRRIATLDRSAGSSTNVAFMGPVEATAP